MRLCVSYTISCLPSIGSFGKEKFQCQKYRNKKYKEKWMRQIIHTQDKICNNKKSSKNCMDVGFENKPHKAIDKNEKENEKGNQN